MFEGYTLYLILLGALLVLVFFGAAIKKLLKKANIDVEDDQIELVSKALSDAIDKMEEINEQRAADGDRPMTSDEKKDLIVSMAKDMALAAGVSEVKLDLVLKMLDAAIYKKSRQKKVKLMRKAHEKQLAREKKLGLKNRGKGQI